MCSCCPIAGTGCTVEPAICMCAHWPAAAAAAAVQSHPSIRCIVHLYCTPQSGCIVHLYCTCCGCILHMLVLHTHPMYYHCTLLQHTPHALTPSSLTPTLRNTTATTTTRPTTCIPWCCCIIQAAGWISSGVGGYDTITHCSSQGVWCGCVVWIWVCVWVYGMGVWCGCVLWVWMWMGVCQHVMVHVHHA